MLFESYEGVSQVEHVRCHIRFLAPGFVEKSGFADAFCWQTCLNILNRVLQMCNVLQCHERSALPMNKLHGMICGVGSGFPIL